MHLYIAMLLHATLSELQRCVCRDHYPSGWSFLEEGVPKLERGSTSAPITCVLGVLIYVRGATVSGMLVGCASLVWMLDVLYRDAISDVRDSGRNSATEGMMLEEIGCCKDNLQRRN